MPRYYELRDGFAFKLSDQTVDNILLRHDIPSAPNESKHCCDGSIRCQERLGGLLKYYYRQVA
jgi:hypothetical protein